MNLAVVLLAAGAGRRFGGAKQIAPLAGKPLMCHVADAAVAEDLPTLVVLGAWADDIAPVLEPVSGKVDVVINPKWETGLGSSIACGVGAAMAAGFEAILLCLADQPGVDRALLRRFVNSHRRHPESIVALDHEGCGGPPVLFVRQDLKALLSLTGDAGARAHLRAQKSRVVLLQDAGARTDIDTPEQLQEFMQNVHPIR